MTMTRTIMLAALLASTAAPAHAAQTPPTIDIPSIAVMENAVNAPIIILKSKASSYSKIQVQTIDGTAKAGVDYVATNQTITLANGVTKFVLYVPLIDNATYQGSRSFNLRVTVIRFGQLPASYTPITVTINDDELPPAPSPPASGLAGETPIPDNFNTAAGLDPTWYGAPPTNRGGIGGLLALTDDAAFRIDCLPGQSLKDDPLVLPGQPGASHLHQFWGNTGTNAGSNYQSLRTTGGTTCGSVQSAPINRSSYWAPAMMVAPGMALKPDHILIYYKRFAANSPACTGAHPVGICVDLPNGIRFVTGYNMKTMSGGPADTRPYQWDFNYMGFDCYGSEDGTIPGGAGEFHTLADMIAANVCPVGARLHVSIDAPECWNGQIDSADHRSHVSYAKGDDYGYGRQCGPDYPYVIPRMSVQLFYNIDANFAKGMWHLSSDEMIPGAIAGSTLHMDYWEAWSPTIKAAWMANCINAPRSCSGGDLGNGTDIIGGNEPYPQGWPKQTAVAATP